MNLLLIGGAFLAAAFGPGPEAPKAPVEIAAETTASTPASQTPQTQKPTPKTEPSQKAAGALPAESQDRGWMTRETHVDQKTGETTEVSVIGFAD